MPHHRPWRPSSGPGPPAVRPTSTSRKPTRPRTPGRWISSAGAMNPRTTPSRVMVGRRPGTCSRGRHRSSTTGLPVGGTCRSRRRSAHSCVAAPASIFVSKTADHRLRVCREHPATARGVAGSGHGRAEAVIPAEASVGRQRRGCVRPPDRYRYPAALPQDLVETACLVEKLGRRIVEVPTTPCARRSRT